MPRDFVHKAFDHWYKRNRKRFRFYPCVVQSRRDYFRLQFQGIVPKISVVFARKTNVEVWVRHQRKFWDIIADFDLCADRTSDGKYFCTLCIEPELFSSRVELWEKHSFEPLLEWLNEHFDESHWLLLFEYGGSTEAKIKRLEEVQMLASNEHLAHMCPVARKTTSSRMKILRQE